MTAELKRILYVEDERDIQSIAELSLQSVGGFAVKICSSGQQALDEGGDFKPDLILLDVMMPEMDGPTTLKNIRQHEILMDTPVIFMTAKVQPQEVEKYLELSAIGVIPKPFDPMTLPEQIREIWAKR